MSAEEHRAPHAGHENAHHGAPRDRHHRHPEKLGAGIDVSSAQGSVDWAAVARAGKREVFAKATEGRTYTDPTWSRARVRAIEKEPKLLPGAYHFARPDNNSPEQEVRAFVSACHGAGAKLAGFADWRAGKGWLGVLDFETPPFDVSWARRWAEAYKKETDHRPLLYGYGSSIGPLAGILDHFSGVWLAAYVADWKPYWRGPASAVRLWQYSDHGSCPGVSGPVDLTKFIR